MKKQNMVSCCSLCMYKSDIRYLRANGLHKLILLSLLK